MAENIVFDIDWSECSKLADEIFTQASGIGRTGKKFEKLKKDAMKMKNVIGKYVNLRWSCKYYDELKLNGEIAVIGEVPFECKAFSQIDSQAVEGVYVYAICVGEFYMPDEPVLNQVYADIWGTAFTDALRTLMKRNLESRAKLSDSFGPGFYGMKVSEMEAINKLLDLQSIGIELSTNMIMKPTKSCAGLYFKVNDKYHFLDTACRSCMGVSKSCRLCSFKGDF